MKRVLTNIFLAGLLALLPIQKSATSAQKVPSPGKVEPKNENIQKSLLLDPPSTQIPNLVWNTFLGSPDLDWTGDIATDGSGNIYIAGTSYATWGSPIVPYYGSLSIAKLDHSGILQWNTFLGSRPSGEGIFGMAADPEGNVYVGGYCHDPWGNPVNPFAGGPWGDPSNREDGCVAKLDTDGNLVWNTFMGASGNQEFIEGLDVDNDGNVYVAGYSYATWGDNPIRGFSGEMDGFVTKLNSEGVRQWNTFLGSTGMDLAMDIAVDGNGNEVVTGISDGTWGSPIQGFAGTRDAFIVSMDPTGTILWNTFVGSTYDYARRITTDADRNIYITGFRNNNPWPPGDNWDDGNDILIAKLNSTGQVQWDKTFGSSEADDGGGDLTIGPNGYIYISGYSYASWGAPRNPHSGGEDGMILVLNNQGEPTWLTFMGTSGDEGLGSLALDGDKNIYVEGGWGATWGNPVRAYSGGVDGLVAKICPACTVYLPMIVH